MEQNSPGGGHLLGQRNATAFPLPLRAIAPQPQPPFSAEFRGSCAAAFSLCPLMLQKWAVR
jgi:hypothetical protein